jgi:CheY-like chemotaxis protein
MKTRQNLSGPTSTNREGRRRESDRNRIERFQGFAHQAVWRRRRDQLRDPDLILLDLRMPEMDGRQFLARKKETPAAETPVIVVTASDASDLEEPHLQKPIDLEHLLNVIAETVRKESQGN